AAREARAVLERAHPEKPGHAEDWESSAVHMRTRLRKAVFGDFPSLPRPEGQLGKAATADGISTTPLLLHPEPDLPLPVFLRTREKAAARQPACVLLHPGGKALALKHPLAAALLEKGWLLAAPDLQATGETKPEHDAIAGAPDHNSAEHALW